MTRDSDRRHDPHPATCPGAVLTYDVRRNDSSTEPVLLLIGSPMGAAGFGTLAGHFADRTVVTYDPRGVERSARTDDAATSTPEEHADDLHRLIAALGAGPVDLFASSGGAVNALALVAAPSRAGPDARRARAAGRRGAARPRGGAGRRAATSTRPTCATGSAPAMAKFIALVSHKGPIPGRLRRPARPGPGDVRAADRGRRLAATTRCSGRT